MLIATGPEVFVATMATFLSDSYDALEETLTQIKNFKLKSFPGENVTDCWTALLVDAERLESAGAFKPRHLYYITCIFEDTSESRLCKEVTEFIKKLLVYDMDVI